MASGLHPLPPAAPISARRYRAGWAGTQPISTPLPSGAYWPISTPSEETAALGAIVQTGVIFTSSFSAFPIT
jgi:hypothetical protein